MNKKDCIKKITELENKSRTTQTNLYKELQSLDKDNWRRKCEILVAHSKDLSDTSSEILILKFKAGLLPAK